MLHAQPAPSGPTDLRISVLKDQSFSLVLEWADLAQGCAIRVQFFDKTVNLTAPLLSSFLTDLSKEASQMAQGCVTGNKVVGKENVGTS